jgi:hypothetical protein
MTSETEIGKQTIGDEERGPSGLPHELPDRLKLLNGFPRAARFVAADPSKTLLVVRRFDEVMIRDLLLLEGKVAALEATQKRLDQEDYEIYRRNDTFTEVASSWEQFALVGATDGEYSSLPDETTEVWCDAIIASLQQKLDEALDLDEDPSSPTLIKLSHRLSRIRAIQDLIDKIDNELEELQKTKDYLLRRSMYAHSNIDMPSDPGSSTGEPPRKDFPIELGLDGFIHATDEFQKRRDDLLKKRKKLLLVKRNELGYDEADIIGVRRRWQVSKALHEALKEYQDAVLRCQTLLGLERPADRTECTLIGWLQGRITTQGQKQSRQFLPGSGLDNGYQDGPPLRPNLILHMLDGIRSRLSRAKSTPTTTSVRDRVSVGRAAAADQLSHEVSRWDWLLRYFRVRPASNMSFHLYTGH